jgi:hypothetical protein
MNFNCRNLALKQTIKPISKAEIGFYFDLGLDIAKVMPHYHH